MEPSMDLNAFPDPVLRSIFNRVPLLDLGRHISLVCHRWHGLQPSVLSGKVKALTIVVGPEVGPSWHSGESTVSILHGDQLTNEDGSRMFPSPMDDPKVALTLTFQTLTSNRVDSLIGALRNVEYLKMSVRTYTYQPPVANAETIPLIGRLLSHWAGSLKTLKLDCSLNKDQQYPTRCVLMAQRNEQNRQLATALAVQLGQLIATVNSLPLLEHLTMDLQEDLRMFTEPLDLPILSRLKEFYFSYGEGQGDLLFRSLENYAEPNRQLRSIGLGNRGKADQYLERFGQSSLAKRFNLLSHVSLDYSNWSLPHVNIDDIENRFLKAFSNLAFYNTSQLDHLNLAQLTATLAPLTRLVHLYLIVDEAFSEFDTGPVDQIQPLPSVKVLTLLTTPSPSHDELASPHWGQMLPNLQIIMILDDAMGCTICGYKKDSDDPEKVAPCVRQTVLPFKEHFRRTLKKVYYCRNGDYDGIQVFTMDTI